MTDHRIATREEWDAAREKLLIREKEHSRFGDELAQERRDLPWLPADEDYRFDTEDGEKTLAELFDGRSQLLIYHFMFGPSYEAGDPVNSSIADAVDAVLPHLHARDVSFVFVSQAPLEKLQAYRRRMGWSFPWVSSAPSGFNFDLGFSHTEEEGREVVEQMMKGGAAADRRSQRPLGRHRRRRVHHREPRVQRVRARGRRRLPDVRDDLARVGVRDDVLPDPRPRPQGPRRGRGRLAALAPPPQRIRQWMTRALAKPCC